MNGQHIPGFYFDKEKGKYFKIQSQSAARGLNLKYSTSNLVKERRKENVQRAATAKQARTQKERVIRRHAHSFVQTDLDREIGFKRRSVYLHTTWPEACLSGVSSTPNPVTSSDSQGIIRFFSRDPISKTIYVVCGENEIKRRYHLNNSQASNLRNPDARARLRTLDTHARYAYYPWDEIGRTTSPISSLQHLPSSGALAVTTLGSDRPPTILLSDPERDGPHIYQNFTPKACSAIFTSSARPSSFTAPAHPSSIAATETEHLAVGAQASLLLFTRSASGTWDSSTLLADAGSDVLALEWLTHSVVAVGCRNGKIKIHDTRVGKAHHALTHPYAITGLKRADDASRLVCAGLQDTLFLYDVRMSRRSSPSSSSSSFSSQKRVRAGDRHDAASTHYTPAYFKSLHPGSHSHRHRAKLQKQARTKWSQPVLSIPHDNPDDPGLGVAVNERLGLVAAVQGGDAAGRKVRVSSLWSGRVVREFDVGLSGGKAGGGGRVRDVQWIDEGDGEDGVRLWCATGEGKTGGIVEFAW